jgi:glycosidase
MKYRLAILVSVVLLISCGKAVDPVVLKPAPTTAPQWTKEAIWYQIMVDRFYNADTSNDPTAATLVGSAPGYIPPTWEITPWTQNWYSPDSYFEDMFGKADLNGGVIYSFDAKVALRRYGGDLQGVLDKLDYLENLGVNAIYFSPINDSPYPDKRQPRSWRHIDVNFGPDPAGDIALIASEDPSDPSTWHMTSADILFLELIKQTKARNMRLILDYSWGAPGQKNADEATSTPRSLAKGDIKSQAAKAHIMAVTRRWLDPNKDGDPSDGVDGFMLSGANNLPLDFWRDYRIYVKSINPHAYLVGDISTDKNTEMRFTAELALQGDVFDGLIDNGRYKAASDYFSTPAQAQMPSQFVSALQQAEKGFNREYVYSSINISASHETSRLLSALLANSSEKTKGKGSNNKNYNTLKPGSSTINTAKLLLVFQFTWFGSPQLLAGDEMGMWGNESPHHQKPLIWPEYSFANESEHPLASIDQVKEVQFNQDLFDYYQFLVKLRRANPVLSQGAIEFFQQDDKKRLMSYRRYNEEGESAYIVFNTGTKRQQIILPSAVVNTQSWLLWHSNDSTNILQSVPSEQLSIDAQSAIVIITKR